MGILNDISKKAQEYAGIAVDKAKDLAEVAADKAQTLSDTAKTNMAIMNEQRELEKNYRAIGEWFVAEHQSDCLLYTSPSPRDRSLSRMPSSA